MVGASIVPAWLDAYMFHKSSFKDRKEARPISPRQVALRECQNVKTEQRQKLERQVKPLVPPDSHHLQAAEGWLELGNHLEANEELKKIGLTGRFHPQVLLTRWEIYARAKHWEFAHTIAQGMVALLPEEPVGWVNRSYALHQLRRTTEAWYSLLPAAEKFPKNLTVAYNLACYSCQLGRLTEASKWLRKAMSLADPNQVQLIALEDPDLRPLWELNSHS